MKLQTTNEQRAEATFLSLQTTRCLKGVLACMVLLSHLHGRVELFSHSLLGTVFTAMGYLAVGVFFFLSGYGLCASMEKKKDYLQHFIGQKFLPFYVVYLCLCAVYAITMLIFKGSVEGSHLLLSVLYGRTVVISGWYLQAQMLLYLIFYLSFQFTKNGLRWTLLATVLYCVVCPLVGLSSTWYETVPCFVLGLWAAKNKEHIQQWLQKRTLVISAGAINLIVFAGLLLIGNKSILPDIVRIPVKMLSAYSFVALAVLFVTIVKTENPVTAFLGDRSLELYALQGVFLELLRPAIANDWLYMLVVTLTLLVVAVAAKPVLTAINKKTAALCLSFSKKGE